MSLKYAIALAAFFALASAARADKTEMQVTMSKTDFDAARSRLIQQLDSSADIAPKDKAAVIGALDRIGQHLAKRSKDDQDLVDIFNDQELIKQIATHAKEESRLYCKRNSPTGSHVMKVTCMSMANWTEQEKDGQAAMKNMVDNHRSHCAGCIYDGTEPVVGPFGG
jgi:hypothetical protein